MAQLRSRSRSMPIFSITMLRVSTFVANTLTMFGWQADMKLKGGRKPGGVEQRQGPNGSWETRIVGGIHHAIETV